MISKNNFTKLIIMILILASLLTVLTGCFTTQQKIDFYQKKLENDNADTRLNAIEKLSKIQDAEILTILSNVVYKDTNGDVRAAALNSIVQMTSENIMSLLIFALDDENESVRLTATTKLGDYPTARSMNALILRLSDKSTQVQQAAYQSMLSASQSPESLDKVLDIFKYSENEEHINTALSVIRTNIKNNTIDYDTLLLAAFPEDESEFISQIDKLLRGEIPTNETLQNHVIMNFLSDEPDILYASKTMFDSMRRWSMEDVATQKFIELYYLPDYEEKDLSPKIGNALSYVYDYENYVLTEVYAAMASAEENISKRIEESLIYLYFDNESRNPYYFSLLFKSDISEFNQQYKDFVMALAYAEIPNEERNALECFNLGKEIWDAQQKTKTITQSLLDSYKYINDSSNTEDSAPLGFISLLSSKHQSETRDALFAELEVHLKSDSEYAEKIMDLAFEEFNAEAYLDRFFEQKIKYVAGFDKNEDLEDGHQGIIILMYHNKGYGDNIYSLYKYYDMPFYSRAYSLSQIRYVIHVSYKNVIIGIYSGTKFAAIRNDVKVKVVDKKTGEVISSKSFLGKNPPSVIYGTPTSLSITGEIDWEKIDAYVMEQVEFYSTTE